MKIAFCSCSKHHKEPKGHGWSAIFDEKPNLLLFLGDLAYAPSWKWRWRKSKYKKRLAKLEQRYQMQFEREDFAKLIEQVPYGAVWDDHDFAWNNACGLKMKPAIKSGTLALFNRFHAGRIQPVPNRVHQSFVFDAEPSVRFILLDGRTYRDKPKKKRSMIGSEQLEWLKAELEEPEEIAVVVSGSCLTRGGSKWRKHKHEYDDVIEKFRGRRKVLFLGGDIHENDFVTKNDGYHEIISSGVGRHEFGNYGIVDIGSNEIFVRLGGRLDRDKMTRTIDRETWIASS